MCSQFRVAPAVTFQKGIERFEEHIVQRELTIHVPDDTRLFRFRDAVDRAMGILSFAPYSCCRFETHRELIIPFGHGECVVSFAIRDLEVVLLAARDPHEHDYR